MGRGWGSFTLKKMAKMMELTSNGLQTAKSKLFFTFYINIPKRNEFAFSFAKSSNTDRVQSLVELIRGLFLESPGKPFRVCRVYIQDSKNFETNTSKLSVKEAKLTGLWTRNCANIKQVWILKFAFGTEKFPALWRNRPLKSGRSSIQLRILVRLG